jgi:hypothetical protein
LGFNAKSAKKKGEETGRKLLPKSDARLFKKSGHLDTRFNKSVSNTPAGLEYFAA